VAAGLIAALHRRGALVVFAFVVASLAGTGIHLLSWGLPRPELMIALSVVLFGVLLVARQLRLSIVVLLAAASGVFHGYAYGESIVGADMTPLWAYLLGLALIQLVVGLTTRKLVQTVVLPSQHRVALALRLAGIAIGCVGLTYLVMQ
jgi:urease accessory protein